MPKRQPRQPRQHRYDPLAVLAEVARYQRESDGRSPSQRRIQRALDISAPSVAHTILHRLERRNLIIIRTYGRGLGADLTLTEAGREALAAWQQRQSDDSDR